MVRPWDQRHLLGPRKGIVEGLCRIHRTNKVSIPKNKKLRSWITFKKCEWVHGERWWNSDKPRYISSFMGCLEPYPCPEWISYDKKPSCIHKRLIFKKIECSMDVLYLPLSIGVIPLAKTYTSKVEPQGHNLSLLQGLWNVGDNVVLHIAPELRMRMTDNSRRMRTRCLWQGQKAFDLQWTRAKLNPFFFSHHHSYC